MSFVFQVLRVCGFLLLLIPETRGSAQMLTPAQVAWARAHYQHEPSASELINAAIKTSRLSPARASRAASRARMAGWIPRLSVGARRGQTRDLSQFQATYNDRTNRSTDDHLSIEAALVFDFDRLIFADQEATLLREERARALERQELVELVVDLYYERRRLQYQRDFAGTYDVDMYIKIARLGALLDGLTDGALSRHGRSPSVVNR
ncbi:MAG: hypothetical protein H6714_03495 [Myxococcales bacterium]|nr:hypothetical protein [Myxococcales bacterium]